MMVINQNMDYLQEILKNYPIEERYENILMQIQDVLEALDILDFVEINEYLLGQAIIDYFEDIDKLTIKRPASLTRINPLTDEILKKKDSSYQTKLYKCTC